MIHSGSVFQLEEPEIMRPPTTTTSMACERARGRWSGAVRGNREDMGRVWGEHGKFIVGMVEISGSLPGWREERLRQRYCSLVKIKLSNDDLCYERKPFCSFTTGCKIDVRVRCSAGLRRHPRVTAQSVL